MGAAQAVAGSGMRIGASAVLGIFAAHEHASNPVVFGRHIVDVDMAIPAICPDRWVGQCFVIVAGTKGVAVSLAAERHIESEVPPQDPP